MYKTLLLMISVLGLIQFNGANAMVPVDRENPNSIGLDALIERINQANNYDDIDDALAMIAHEYAQNPDILQNRFQEIIDSVLKSYPIAGFYIIDVERINNIEACLANLARIANFTSLGRFITIEEIVPPGDTHHENRKRKPSTIFSSRKKQKLVDHESHEEAMDVGTVFKIVKSNDVNGLAKIRPEDFKRFVLEKDRYGNTLLHYAAKSGNKDLILMLIKSGAIIDATNHSDKTPFNFLSVANRRELALHLHPPSWKAAFINTIPEVESEQRHYQCSICFKVCANNKLLAEHLRATHENAYLVGNPAFSDQSEILVFPNRISFLNYFEAASARGIRHTHCRKCNFWAYGITPYHCCKNFCPPGLQSFEKHLRDRVFSSRTIEEYRRNIKTYSKNFTIDNAPMLSKYGTLLGEAVATGNVDAVHALLEFGPSIFVDDANGISPFFHAVDFGRFELVSLLVQHKLASDSWKVYPWLSTISTYTEKRNFEVVQAIIAGLFANNGFDSFNCFDALEIAIENDDRRIGDLLFDAIQAKPFTWSVWKFAAVKALQKAVKHNNEYFVRKFLDSRPCPETLIYVFAGEHSFDPPSLDDRNCLNIAADEKNAEMVALLLSYTKVPAIYLAGGGYVIKMNNELAFIKKT